MKFDLDLSELAKLGGDIVADAAMARGAIEPAVGRAIDQLHGWSVSAAPVGETGELKGGIRKDTSGLARRVYGTSDHDFYQEYGTSFHPPQPFLMVFADRAHGALEIEVSKAKWGLNA